MICLFWMMIDERFADICHHVSDEGGLYYRQCQLATQTFQAGYSVAFETELLHVLHGPPGFVHLIRIVVIFVLLHKAIRRQHNDLFCDCFELRQKFQEIILFKMLDDIEKDRTVKTFFRKIYLEYVALYIF